jgi:mono/diheme cytochrome c family protein
MMKNKLRFALLVTLVALPALAQTDMLKDLGDNAWNMPGYPEVRVLTPPPTTPEDLVTGKQLSEVYCISCHGMNLDGEGFVEGANMTPPQSLRYTRNYHLGSQSLAIFRTIKYGIPELMQSYEEPMTDAQIWALTAYVRSMQKE